MRQVSGDFSGDLYYDVLLVMYVQRRFLEYLLFLGQLFCYFFYVYGLFFLYYAIGWNAIGVTRFLRFYS